MDRDGNTVESVSVKHGPQKKRYLSKPVWVLTGRNTASAAELFAGVLQATGRARLVGEQTAGAGYYPGVRNITDTLVFRISLLKPVIAATGENREKTGLTPDIGATSSDALDQVIQTILSIH